MRAVKSLGVALAGMFIAAGSASAQVLDFENINTVYPFANSTFVNEFYNGGTSSIGTTGTNYGISFSSNALVVCLNSLDVSCSNGSRGGQGNPNSARAGLFFLSGSAAFMNREAGFEDGFSFFYSAVNNPGSFSVWSGLNGTGDLLASLALGVTVSNCPEYSASFCPFVAAGVDFDGVARSVTFAGVADQIAFDDVTFGSSTPGVQVPEPATFALLLLGMGGMAAVSRRRRTT